jgi:hypothetical protein
LAPYFAPIQLGVGVSVGCEAAVHACRRYVEGMPDDNIMVELDFNNAFNCIHRDAMLDAVLQHAPEIYPFCYLAYGQTSYLKYGNRTIPSQEGIQHGDPLSSLIFCLTIHPLLRALSSDFIVGYMDDITIGGPETIVASDVSSIKTNGITIGVVLNTEKCESISKCTPCSCEPLNNFQHIDVINATLLGAPLSTGAAMDLALEKMLIEMEKASSRLRLISSHDALVLLKTSCGSPRLLHLLRSAPCAGHFTLPAIDLTLRRSLSDITNTLLSDAQWSQASLPISAGGIGIRSVTSIASPAFLASVSRTEQLQSQLLVKCPTSAPNHHFIHQLDEWLKKHPPGSIPSGSNANKQRMWDKPSVDATFADLLNSQQDDHNRARLIASAAPHSGDWLHALPISSCGLRLDNEMIRVAVGLRLGVNLCDPHVCPCGVAVDCRGTHGLSCKRSAGRTARHSHLNDIVHHALVRASVSSVKVPVGLSRSDGKRPDGLTLVPWQGGKCAIWDVTVADTLANS